VVSDLVAVGQQVAAGDVLAVVSTRSQSDLLNPSVAPDKDEPAEGEPA